MKKNETFLPLKRPSAGPFFKSILAEIYFTIYSLTTQIPDGFYVAIEKHRKVVAPEISGIILCYWEEKYCTMGVEEAEIANHRVKIFCIEKSVCDAVKFRNKIGTEVAVEVLRNYLKRKDRNISRLMDYAKQMRVLSTMRQYLEMGL